MLKRILLYMKHRHHDKIRRQKLFLWEVFRVKDNNFDYRKQLRGNFWYYINNKNIKEK